jgi:hypothetical protein
MTTVVAPVQAPEDIVELRPRMPLQHTLARWLNALKPEWYPSASAASANFEHEFAQAGTTSKIWVVVQNARPRAWLMARRVPDERRQVEIVRLGAEVAGGYEAAAPGCALLIERAAAWATDQGAAQLIHWTGTEGLAVHGRPLEDLWTTMQEMGGGDSPTWTFWVEQEFMLWGLLPDMYGTGRHGALLARTLRR